MNLYKYHSKPNSLKHRSAVATHHDVEVAWHYADELAEQGKEIPKDLRDRVIKNNSWNATQFATDIINDRLPEYEQLIAQRFDTALHYALYALNDKFPLFERKLKNGDYDHNVVNAFLNTFGQYVRMVRYVPEMPTGSWYPTEKEMKKFL